MAIELYDTHTLVRVIETLKPDLSNYWLNSFFPSTINFDQEYIDFDEVDNTRRLAPFVAPTNQGRVLKDRGYTTKRFKPAYVKPKHVVDPTKFVRRRAGEGLMGELSLNQRRELVIANNLLEQRRIIERRWEWMAAQATIYGAVTVAGEDYPSVVVDFNRAAGNTVTLSGTSLWTDTTNSDPAGDLETWAQLIHTATGYNVTKVTVGNLVFKALRAHPKVKDLLDTTFRGSNSSIDRGPQNTTNARKVGELGTIEIWVYSDLYEDENDVVQQMMPQDLVVMVASEGFAGYQAFGAIMDARAGYQPLRMFSKNWENEDPSVEYLMTQSAPLMIPLRSNCSLKAKVV